MKTRIRDLWLSAAAVVLAFAQSDCGSVAKTQPSRVPRTCSASMTLSYWRDSGGRLYLPLLIETPPSGQVYPNPVQGIQIERVEVDGRTVLPMMDGTMGGAFRRGLPVLVEAPLFLYQVEADTWDYADEERPKDWNDYALLNLMTIPESDWDQFAYRIPYDALCIRIEYRPRYPVDGHDELGPLMTVVAERYDHARMQND